MPHPATYFIRFLLLATDEVSAEEISEKLLLAGMGPLTAGDLRLIQQEMPREPEGFRPWDRAHGPSMKWLRTTKVHSLLHRDAPVRECFQEILRAPRTREVVERMLIGGLHPQEVSYRLQTLRIKLSPTAVAEFRHYFWNTEIMGVADWAAYFDSVKPGSRLGRLEKDYEAALLGGADLALYRSGIKTAVDTKTVMEGIMAELWFTFQEVKTLPLSAKKVEMLANIVRGITRVDERLQQSDTALQDVLKNFEKFKVQHDTSPLPRLHDLAPGGTVSNKSRAELAISRES